MRKSNLSTKERFMAFIAIKSNGCWEWTGSKLKDGYGSFKFEGRTFSAHRVSWLLFRGEIPIGKHILHSCDSTGCCNPDHLWIGTNRDNMHDKVAKGRAYTGNQKEAALKRLKYAKKPRRNLSDLEIEKLLKQVDIGDTSNIFEDLKVIRLFHKKPNY